MVGARQSAPKGYASPLPEGIRYMSSPSRFDPQNHHRQSIRLKEYDYTQPGAYFVTSVTRQRACWFGDIHHGTMVLNAFGHIADECWRAIPEHFPAVELGAYVIMPNHVHGIIVIADRTGAALLRPNEPLRPNVKPGSLGAIIRSYKSAVSYRIHREHNATGIWQRNYYEPIIRTDADLHRITEYIHANPLRWNDDDENPARAKT